MQSRDDREFPKWKEHQNRIQKTRVPDTLLPWPFWVSSERMFWKIYIISFISLSLPSVTWLQCLFYCNAVSTRWCLVNRAGRWRLVNRAGTRQRWVRGHQKSYNQDNILKSQNQGKILRQTRYPIFKYSILSLGGKFVFHIWEIIRQTIIYYR